MNSRKSIAVTYWLSGDEPIFFYSEKREWITHNGDTGLGRAMNPNEVSEIIRNQCDCVEIFIQYVRKSRR